MWLGRAFPRLRSFVAALFRRETLDRAMDDEFALHIELRVADLVRAGVSRAEAERQARLEFGNLTTMKETARTSWRTAWADVFHQDLGFALRTLRKNPGFTLVAILSLGVGIGSTTTVFSVIDALDFRPLAFKDPDRLVWLAETTPRDHPMCSRCSFLTAAQTAADWAAAARSLDLINAVGDGDLSWEDKDTRESVRGDAITPGFFRMLGVRPLLGRDFTPDDTAGGAAPVVIVSYEFWQSRLGADRGVIGRRLPLRGSGPGRSSLERVTVVGVMPAQFRFADDVLAWTPLRLGASTSRSYRDLTVVARLGAGRTMDEAAAELQTITARLALAHPVDYRDWGAAIEPLRHRFTWGTGKGRYVLFAITTLVLFVAVLNVTGLLLGRAAAREQEFAMRAALGASRRRLLRQLLVEGCCVGVGGGAVGILLSTWAVGFAARWLSVESTGLAVSVDHRMLMFAAAVSLIVGVAAAVAPAVRAASVDPSGTLRRRAGGVGVPAARVTYSLIAAQIAVALILLTAAGLLSRDFVELRFLDLGYEPHGLYYVSLSGNTGPVVPPAAWRPVVDQVQARVANIPGITSSSLEHLSAVHPTIVRAEAAAAPTVVTPVVKAVSANYFATFGTRLSSGRPFASSDVAGTPLVAIVNKAAAATLWPGLNPIGQRLVVGDSGTPGELLTVIGVSANAERGELADRHWPMVYRPFAQSKLYHSAAALYVRVEDNASTSLVAALSVIRDITGRPSYPFKSAESALGRRFLAPRLNAIILDAFAGFGLLLAAMGIYGSVAYAVTQRTREIGIRIALGAERRSVVGLVARRVGFATIGGVCLGFVGALALTRVLGSFISSTSVTNPWIFGGASLLMVAIASTAALLPARRATRVDAMIALRS